MRFLALLAALVAVPASAQLSGTYTIDPSQPPGRTNFPSFADALDALTAYGVSGRVTVEVAQATYAEKLVVRGIPGISPTNTVTFLGVANGDTLPEIVADPSAAEPYVVRVEKAAGVVFDNLRIAVADPNQERGTVLLIESDGVTIRNCEVESIDDGAVGTYDAVGIDAYGNDVRIEGNTVNDGEVGIRVGATPGGPASGTEVWANTVRYAVRTGILVEGQVVASGNAVSIRDNVVSQSVPDDPAWVGIWLRDHVGGAVLARNTVWPRGGLGVRLQNIDNETTAWISLVNTMVVGNPYILLPGVQAGIEVLGSERVRIQNNSVRIRDETGTAVLVDGASQTVDLRNNILVHEGEGLLLDVENAGSIVALDYSVFQASEQPTQFVAEWGGATYTDFAEFQSVTEHERDGIVWPVAFSTDLHLAGRSIGDGRLIGEPLGSVPSDIDGDARDPVRPYRGADEAAVPLTDPLPFMAGEYGIDSRGASGKDVFGSFTDALAALDERGVSGPVTFRVQPGVYTEQLEMGAVPGAIVGRPVRFVAAAGTPSVQWDAVHFNDDYVLWMLDVEHVTFEGLEFRSLDPDYGGVIDIDGGHDITFDGCTVRAVATQAGGAPITLFSAGRLVNGINGLASGGNADRIRVLNSLFDGGSNAIDIWAIESGTAYRKTGNHEVTGNTIQNLLPRGIGEVIGIEFNQNVSGAIRDNRIVVAGSEDNFVGIKVGGAPESPISDVVVERNEVVADDGTGIHWEHYTLDDAPPGTVLQVVNNTVRMNGDGPTVGLRALNPDGALFAHNTVSVASTDPASAAVAVEVDFAGYAFELLNNVLDANAGRALALDLSGLNGPVFDGNALSSQGDALASYHLGGIRFNGDCADVDCMRSSTATSAYGAQDLTSIEATATFEDAAAGDLHLTGPSVGDPALAAGVGVPEVAQDMDGDARSPTAPYRGADEGSAVLASVEVRVVAVLQGAYPGSPVVNGSIDRQSQALYEGGLLPLSNPYADPAFDGTPAEYDGTESLTQAELDANWWAVDWVVVALRETPTGPDVARAAGLMSVSGGVTGVDGDFNTLRLTGTEPGDYYVVVYHRNHLPVMSAEAHPLQADAPGGVFVRLYQSENVWGGADALVLLEGDGGQYGGTPIYGMPAGDASGDGLVTAPDFNVYAPAAAAGAAGYHIEDYTMDGVVSAPDFNLYNANAAAGVGSVVPAN